MLGSQPTLRYRDDFDQSAWRFVFLFTGDLGAGTYVAMICRLPSPGQVPRRYSTNSVSASPAYPAGDCDPVAVGIHFVATARDFVCRRHVADHAIGKLNVQSFQTQFVLYALFDGQTEFKEDFTGKAGEDEIADADDLDFRFGLVVGGAGLEFGDTIAQPLHRVSADAPLRVRPDFRFKRLLEERDIGDLAYRHRDDALRHGNAFQRGLQSMDSRNVHDLGAKAAPDAFEFVKGSRTEAAAVTGESGSNVAAATQ